MRTRRLFRGALLLVFPLLAYGQAPDTAWTWIIPNTAGTWVDRGTEAHDGGGVVVGIYQPVSEWNSWIVRFGPDGDTVWTRMVGGPYGEYGRDIVRMGDTGYVMLGKQKTSTNGDYYVWFVGLDTSGNTLWQKLMSRTENPWALALATDTGFCVVASYESAVGTKNDIVIIRTSSKGDTVWSKRFGGAENDDPEAIVATPDSGFIVLANTSSYGLGNGDLYVLRLNKRGDTLWTKTFGGAEWDVGYQIERTSDGNYLIVGGTYSFGVSGQVYAIKISQDGTVIWESKVGGPGARAYDCDETPDGGFLLGGLIYAGTNNDMYFVRIDRDGNFLWDKRIGKGTYESGVFVLRLPDGSPLLVGKYGSSSGLYIVKLLPEAVAVDDAGWGVPEGFALAQSYPNPFNAKAVIRCQWSVAGIVRLVVYDVLGREVAVLIDERRPPGHYQAEFDGTALASGVYFYRLTSGAHVETRKMLLMK